MKGVRAGLVAGVAIASIAVACVRDSTPRPTGELRMQKLNLVTNLWTQIRGWRHDAGMELDPLPTNFHQLRNKTVKEIERVCGEGHEPPKACEDVCSLADAICDNAEAICEIADELKDAWALEKCGSAKASCKEAKQRCCNCAGDAQ